MKKHTQLAGLRIAYFSFARIPSRTANSIHVMRMCHAMASHGCDVRLFVPKFASSEYEEVSDSIFEYYGVNRNFKIIKYPWLPFKGRSTFYSFLASMHARLTGTELVYARDLKSCYFCTRLGMPVIFEAHAPIKKDEPIFSKLISSRYFNYLVVISDALRKIFEEIYPQLTGKILVAHDAADLEDASPDEEGNSTDRLKVGYVGHLYQGRGIDLIIELAQLCPWADFEIVGGMKSDLEYWKSKSEEVKNIHFHGHLPYNQAGRIRRKCQILLAPFARKLEVYDGGSDTSSWMSPMKIFEYMAAGKAIICSDLPVLREVLVDEETALLCEAENVDQWRQALERLKQDPSLMKHIGLQARKNLEKNHTWFSRARTVLDGAA